jgi:predicted TPR repeat methyltransferase
VKAALPAYERAIALAPASRIFSSHMDWRSRRRPGRRDAAAAYRRYLELEPGSAEAEKVKARLAELAGK